MLQWYKRGAAYNLWCIHYKFHFPCIIVNRLRWLRWIWVNTSPVIITIILVARTERKGRQAE